MTRYHIMLTCGCAVISKNPPMNPGAKLPCPNSLGHGYNLPWRHYTAPNGTHQTNPKDNR